MCVHEVTLGYQGWTGRRAGERRGNVMIILGIILIIVGYIVPISVVAYIGWILLVVGLILTVLGMVGRGIGGRKTYF